MDRTTEAHAQSGTLNRPHGPKQGFVRHSTGYTVVKLVGRFRSPWAGKSPSEIDSTSDGLVFVIVPECILLTSYFADARIE